MRDPMKFLRLCQMLNLSQCQGVFASDFVKYALAEFWETYYRKMLYQQFLPYVFCITATITFL